MHTQSLLPMISVPRAPYLETLLLVPFIVDLYHDSLDTAHYGPFFRIITFLYFFVPPVISLAYTKRSKSVLEKIVRSRQIVGLYGTSLALMVVWVVLGLKTAAILVSQDATFGTATLDTESRLCVVRVTQANSSATPWSGILYIIGISLLIVNHAASAMTYLSPSGTKLKTVPEPKVSLDREDFRLDANKTGSNVQIDDISSHNKGENVITVEKEEEALRKSFEIVDTPPSFPPSSARRMEDEEKKKEKKSGNGKKKGKNTRGKRSKLPSSDPDEGMDV